MYGLRTAKEARDAKLREWAVSDGVKDLLNEVNTRVEQAILKDQSRFVIVVPADRYEKDTEENDGDITEVKRILESYGYYVQIGPSLDENKQLHYSIYVSF
ncbi:hypothetical protein [Bacillus phage SPO1L3]|nr:hypothetical protein [Bacillus phage SPO1L3]WIT26763.1 hypothetical protein [Bacillus phage SPO1L5]